MFPLPLSLGGQGQEVPPPSGIHSAKSPKQRFVRSKAIPNSKPARVPLDVGAVPRYMTVVATHYYMYCQI